MVNISVLMPCYNEMKTVKANIHKTVKTLEKSDVGSFELIIIDDGSSDDTFNEINTYVSNNEFVRICRLRKNGGKGNALRKGFQYVNGSEYVCFLDGDFDIHPRQIQTFMKIMKEEKADVIIGSKRHALSNVNYPLPRKILSFGYQSFIKMLFRLSIKDSQVGIKLFKKKVLDDVFPRVLVKKYAFDIELLSIAHRKGYKINEAPVDMNFSNVGSSVTLKSFLRMFIDTCAIFYRTYVIRYYDHEGENHCKKKRLYLFKNLFKIFN